MSATVFIGLDLAWNIDANHSGIAVLKGDERGVSLKAVSEGACSSEAVLSFVAKHSGPDSVIAIDCPLVVANETGQRPCENEAGMVFSTFHAAPYSTSKSRLYWNVGPNMALALGQHGYKHNFDIGQARRRSGRWLFEIYPHPAMVRLFSLERIIKYKKGRVDEKKAGLKVLREYLRNLEGLAEDELWRELLARDLVCLKGEALKRYEDTLDAMFCAYLAWYCWRWGAEKNEVFGVLEKGYIVVPKALEAP
jgi:predicted RNase H-like nuclease